MPNSDPSVLVAALSTHTEHLGLAFTSSVLQAHPFEFARRISTLDHLSNGRIGWNIVTSALDGAARNFGDDRLEEHDERYVWTQEYVDVMTKLWEGGSWDDDAFLADKAAGVVSDAGGIHRINHVGKRYRVAGPHLAKPSPQRTPVLFQAGSSPAGRAFAARNAEAQFILTSTKEKTAELISATRKEVSAAGRHPEDLKFFLGLSFVVGSTQEEAERRSAEIDDLLAPDGFLVHSNLGYDPETGATLDPDTPLSQVKTHMGQSHLQWLQEASPNREPTIRDLAGLSAKLRARVVGTPGQIADELESWQRLGVDGINVMNWHLPGRYADFVDHVVPELQRHGLTQRDYVEGTLRRKIFGHDQLPDRHPARAWRGAFSSS